MRMMWFRSINLPGIRKQEKINIDFLVPFEAPFFKNRLIRMMKTKILFEHNE